MYFSELRSVWQELTAPGARYETLRVPVTGCPGYRHAPETLRDFWTEAGAAFAERTYLVFGDERLSYDKVFRQSERVAAWMQAQGISKGDRIAVAMRKALSAFRDYWANPAYGLDDAPGIFFQHSFGPIDLFMLDNRFERSPVDEPDGPTKTALGVKQREWLIRSLKKSRAPFKILASGQGWTDGKAFGGQSWVSFANERDLILDAIRENNITGVILLSGDTHVAELNALPGSEAGYDFVECVSSPLAQETAMSWLNYRPVPRLRQVYAGGCNFGLLDFDFSSSDPSVRLNVYNTRGEPVWEPVELHASDLKLGRSIWTEKMDSVSKRRWDKFTSTGIYYT